MLHSLIRCSAISALLLAAATVSAAPPNILLILTDDQGWGDIHAHANPAIDTPHLDKLASDGASFDRFYVAPVCAPTRASLLTGRWHPRCGVHGVTRGAENMRASEFTIAEILRDAGYRTGCFGKWHNGANFPHDPNGQGFDEFLGFTAGHWDLYFDSPLRHNQGTTTGEGFLIDHLTDKAIEFIHAGSTDQPWFCYVPFNTPHTPWQVPEAYWQEYSDRGLEPTTACAYAMVDNIDHNVGRMLDALKTMNAADNTIVLFLTDNGANTDRWDGDMRGQKGSLHEGGSRVPLFVRYPARIAPGTQVSQLAAHIDLLPTLLELAELQHPQPQNLDGISLVPVLTSAENSAQQDRMLFNHWAGRGAVRTPQWRLVQGGRDLTRPQWMLFDMLADPSETNDLASQHPKVTAELAAAYQTWWQDVSQTGFDPIPIEIGHSDAPVVRLAAHESRLQGEGISYNGRNGWANDWIDHFTARTGTASWPIKVVTPGTYQVKIRYSAHTGSVGTKLVIRCGNSDLSWTVDESFASQPLDTQDRIPRKETTPQTWREVTIGELTLSPAAEQLTLSRTADGPSVQIQGLELSR